MKKKVISMLLTGAMAASLLAGCGGSSSSEGGSSTSGNQTEAESAESGDQYAAEIDMDEDPYEVALQVIVLPGSDFSEIEPKLEDALNAIALPAVNATVDLQFLSIAEMAQTTQLAVASQGVDKIDLVSVSTVMKVDTMAGKELLLDLNEGNLLQNRGKDLVAMFEDAMKVGNVGGQQIAVPALCYYGQEGGIYYNKNVAEAAGVTLPETGTLEELEKALYVIKEKNPEMMGCYTGTGNMLRYQFFYGGTTFGSNAKYGAILDKDSTTIENLYESEEFLNYCKTMLKWHQDGLLPQSDNSDTASAQDYFGANKLFFVPSGLTPYEKANYIGKGKSNGIDVGFMITSPATIASTNVAEYMWGIASSCPRPDKAMDVLNLLYSNTEFANLLQYGFEGENYEKTGDNTVAINYSYFPTFYRGGDTSKMYNTVGDSYIGEMEEMEKNAAKAASFGYLFLDAEYQTESAVLEDTISKYLPKLETGLFADEAEMQAWLDEFNAALEAAGIKDVIAGNQEQLDAFLAE